MILTEDNEVLGGFVDDFLQYDGNRYHGTGDCFLFGWNCRQAEGEEVKDNKDELEDLKKVEPQKAEEPKTNLLQGNINGNYQHFKSTGNNNFYFFCDSEGFGFGGE